MSEGRAEVLSAGVRPGIVHPLAVQALGDLGIDITAQRSKHLDEVRDQSFDRVITVCDQVREQCPAFPGGPHSIHWSIADPIAAAERTEDEDARRTIFAATARELRRASTICCLPRGCLVRQGVLASYPAPRPYATPTAALPHHSS